MIALVGFAATANFKTLGNHRSEWMSESFEVCMHRQNPVSGSWCMINYCPEIYAYITIAQVHMLSTSTRTYIISYIIYVYKTISVHFQGVFLQIFFSLFGLLWSPHLLHCLWPQTFKGKKGSKAAPVGVSQKGIFLRFMKIDV